MPSWHEEDRNWLLSAPLIFREERVSQTRQQVDDLMSLLQLSPGMRVLDLCCGNGRHALEMARRGLHVTGVDRTAAFIEEAERLARAEGLEVEWLVDDARTFSRPGAFDVAMCLGASFSYFDTREEDQAFVGVVHESLRPGGRFVLEADGKEIVARDLVQRQWWPLGDTVALAEMNIRGAWETLETRWIALVGQERIELTTTQRLYSGLEGVALLERGGFRSVAVYGHQDGRPYDQSAVLQVFVATRG